MSPGRGMAFGLLAVVSLIISALGLINAPVSSFGMVAVFIFIGLLVASVLLYVAARLVKVPNASFSKMIVLSACVSLVTNVVGLVLGLAGLSVVILFIINIIIVIALMRWYLQISVLKSIGILVVEILIGFVLGLVLFFTVGMGVIKMFLGGVAPNMDKAPTVDSAIMQDVNEGKAAVDIMTY